MYCPNCEKDIGESKFCPECGKNLTGSEEVLNSEKNKKGKFNKKVIIAIVVALIVIFIIVVGFTKKSGNKEKTNNIEISFSAVSDTETVSTTQEDNKKVISQAIESAKKLASEGNYAEAIKTLNSVTKTDEITSLINQYAKDYLIASDFGCYWKEDDMSDYHWAYAKGQDSSTHDFSFCVYIHQNKTNPEQYGFHLYSSFTGYSGKDEWIFPNSMRIKGDKNEAIDINIGFNNKSDMDGRKLQEWINLNITQEQFEEICKTANESSTITIRFNGTKYYRDFTLTAKQIEDLIIIGNYGEAFGNVYGVSE